jgi:hypothetical protein
VPTATASKIADVGKADVQIDWHGRCPARRGRRRSVAVMLRAFVELLTEALDSRCLLFKALVATLDQLTSQHLLPESRDFRPIPDLDQLLSVDIPKFLNGFATWRYGAIRLDMKVYPGRHTKRPVGRFELSPAGCHGTPGGLDRVRSLLLDLVISHNESGVTFAPPSRESVMLFSSPAAASSVSIQPAAPAQSW